MQMVAFDYHERAQCAPPHSVCSPHFCNLYQSKAEWVGPLAQSLPHSSEFTHNVIRNSRVVCPDFTETYLMNNFSMHKTSRKQSQKQKCFKDWEVESMHWHSLLLKLLLELHETGMKHISYICLWWWKQFNALSCVKHSGPYWFLYDPVLYYIHLNGNGVTFNTA